MNLNVCKSSKSLHSTFPAESAAAHSSRREHHVRLRHFVHEPHSYSHLVNHLLSSGLRVDRTSQSVGRAVGDGNGVLIVPDLVQGEDRPEKLVVIRSLLICLDECYRIERLFHVLSSKHNLPGLGHLRDELGQVEVQVRTSQRTHLSFRLSRVSCLDRLQLAYQQRLELVVYFLMDYITFWGEADLTSIAASSSYCVFDSLLHIRVLQDYERVVPAQLHHACLQVLPCCLRYYPSRSRRTRERYPTDDALLHYQVQLIGTCQGGLELVLETSLSENLLGEKSSFRTSLSRPRENDVSEEQVRQSAFEEKIERVVEWNYLVQSSLRLVFYQGLLLCI